MRACSIDGCERPHKARGMCNRHYQAWRYAENPEVREKRARRYAENPEKVRERLARWRAENPEKQARWYAENREKIRERSAQWNAENPERRRASRSRRRARLRGAFVEDFTREEIYERDGWICGICEEPIDQSLSYPDPMSASLDHVIPLARGGEHSRANAQAAHLRCNVRKKDSVAA